MTVLAKSGPVPRGKECFGKVRSGDWSQPYIVTALAKSGLVPAKNCDRVGKVRSGPQQYLVTAFLKSGLVPAITCDSVGKVRSGSNTN